MSRLSRHLLSIVLLAGLAFLGVEGAHAQINDHRTQALAQQSDVVVVGKVARTKSEWSGNRIVTQVTLDVGESLKGNPGSSLTVTTLGGEVGGVGEWYSHTASFKADEEVVVFARRDAQGRYSVSGGEEGKLAIERDSATGLALVNGKGSLSSFRAEIKAALQGVPKQ
jgi:hypothetical protein